MSISENIKRKILEQQNDPTGQITNELQDQSIAAILGGLGSAPWEIYMNNFADADRPDQLQRLMGKDSEGDPYMRKEIAYLVANASCGSITRTRLDQGLSDGLLDQGL